MPSERKLPSPRATLRCKVILAGDACVGKTSLCSMFHSKGTVFPKNYKLTAGVELVVSTVLIPDTNTTVELQIFDTGGQDIFREYADKYWAGLGMIVLVYDCTSQESFDNCATWLDSLKKHRLQKEKPITGVLVANKSDLSERQVVSSAAAEEWAQSHNLEFFECASMPPGRDVDAPFNYVANQWYKAYEDKMLAVKAMV
mmetsp:Transcript_2616/g.2904  ORF Transcript_2616/g.2904 Transcript_2616/m.2904 type:complete len:200 (-) Transcript_2616:533-1132(-)|eukprot:CAMPEP_0197847820 /NCGR_PEP_ID=MMETSP1438-20131217/7199_1 /TAXON_ID=1461541 /ORGANISM="Pterosperma sp., Strain CCMP1384" /LENGTH=199 /DNA_ID=CAMNT_0043459855 /DNA_START=180 /DNA_END=779 /DNA_ORIENTATION=+